MRLNFLYAALPLLFVSLLCGCATSDKEPTPEEILLADLAQLSESIVSKNPDAIMEFLAPNFYHPEIGHRTDAYTMMNLTLESGFGGGFVLDSNEALFEIDKKSGRAHVYPVILKGEGKEYRLGLNWVLQPEKGEWFVVTFHLEQ